MPASHIVAEETQKHKQSAGTRTQKLLSNVYGCNTEANSKDAYAATDRLR